MQDIVDEQFYANQEQLLDEEDDSSFNVNEQLMMIE